MRNFMEYFDENSRRISEIVNQEAKIQKINDSMKIQKIFEDICISLARPNRNGAFDLFEEEKWDSRIRAMAKKSMSDESI
jgi:hypothetical protein